MVFARVKIDEKGDPKIMLKLVLNGNNWEIAVKTRNGEPTYFWTNQFDL